MPLPNPGDPFPRLTITTAGQDLTFPDAFAGDFAVVLFNRAIETSSSPTLMRLVPATRAAARHDHPQPVAAAHFRPVRLL